MLSLCRQGGIFLRRNLGKAPWERTCLGGLVMGRSAWDIGDGVELVVRDDVFDYQRIKLS